MLRRVSNIIRFDSVRNENLVHSTGMRAVIHNQKCCFRMQMNEDAKQFNTTNKLNRRDAVMCLEEYAPKFTWKKNNIRVLDVGCADGSVSHLLKNYIPKNYEALIGCDISERMVKFANAHYSNDRTRFVYLDIEGDLPNELKGSFDYVFSFYVFHWIRKQEEAFTNIYNLLQNGGGCFLTFVAYTPTYTIFPSLAKTSKWGRYLKDVNKMISPYYDTQSPDLKVTEILKTIGFKYFDVRCKQSIYIYENQNELRDLTMAINPFKFPEESMYMEFANDFVQMAREMKLFNETNNTIKFHYNLMTVHCTK